jgi:hypothetical protein
MLIGVWVLILAVPGFPPSWKTALLLLTGIGIIVFGYRMKPAENSTPKKDLPFTDYKRPQSAEPVQAPTIPPAQPPASDNGSPVA